ncbi:MAG TPA: cell division protein FtsQ/DivIB [Rhodopila sp.]
MKRSPRYSVNDRPAGWRLALRRQRRLLLPAAAIAGTSVAVALLASALHSAAPRTTGTLSSIRERFGATTAASGLRVTDIVIEGRANTPEPLLRAAIGITKGDPILGFSLEATKTRIETIPWVEHATIERRLPGTVVINLQERRPFAVWQNQGKFVLVDRTGQVVTNQDIAQFPHLPLIVGQGAPGSAAELLDALRDRPALEEKVVASVRVGERRWNLRMANGTDVLLPEGHEIVALDKLIQLQQDHAVLDRSLAAIDMRLPDRLVFHPRSDAKEELVVPPVPPGTNPPAVPVIAKRPT